MHPLLSHSRRSKEGRITNSTFTLSLYMEQEFASPTFSLLYIWSISRCLNFHRGTEQDKCVKFFFMSLFYKSQSINSVIATCPPIQRKKFTILNMDAITAWCFSMARLACLSQHSCLCFWLQWPLREFSYLVELEGTHKSWVSPL